MSSKRGDLHQKFYKAHLRAYPRVSNEENQKETNKAWNAAKTDLKNSSEFEAFIESRIKSLDLIATKAVTQKSLYSYFGKQTSKPVANNQVFTKASEKSIETEKLPENSIETEKPVDEKNQLKRKYTTPSQDESRMKIQAFESKISTLTMMRDSNLAGDEVYGDIKKARIEMKKTASGLKRKQKLAVYQKNYRQRVKQKIATLNNSAQTNNSENSPVAQMGRPRKEQEYPDLLKTICDIAIINSAASERRQTEEIRTCSSLKDLTNKLEEKGIKISKSAVYLRLIPKKSNSIEGKKHVETVPVRLCKPQNDLHKQHPDAKFCTSTIRMVDTLASMLGPKQVAYISQDDKARVKIGITAANKQSSRLMHVDYRIKLPDHDWVVASKHTLIPSVYAGIRIQPDNYGSLDAISYSGPTYIAIRSGKHSSSTAATHANDMDTLFKLEEFNDILRINNEIKPVLIISVDGGPDENPRYHKTIAYAIQHFKKYQLDALFVMTNAPGRSAFNRVERRMAPLSRELSGVILPHNFHGDHLNAQKEVEPEHADLELKNFAKAGEALQEIWSKMTIDTYPVRAEYITPDETLKPLPHIQYEWHDKHVRESQYFMQIVKCEDETCCSPFRSDVRLILKDGFFPPPILCKRQENGRLVIADPVKDTNASFLSLFQRLSINLNLEESTSFSIIPYDYHCSTVQESLIDRICPFCNLYFATIKAVKEHRKETHPGQRVVTKKKAKKTPARIIKRRKEEVLCLTNTNEAQDAEWLDLEDINNFEITDDTRDDSEEVPAADIPIVDSIGDWLKCDWSFDK